ncbi:MAG: 50S ribosomal protein L10 [Oscillospiraceae bacterium]|jgi:large subunit ribosomal protein L10|nr:50S ribosomal protein L10 [Oscillospiraceae bacterium]
MPNEKILLEKQQKVDDLAVKLQKSVCGVLVDYRGISVDADTKLRKKLRESGVDYAVVKNSLLKRALAKADITGLDDLLENTTALALSDTDVVTAPKILFEKSEELKEIFNIKGGFIDGAAVPVETVIEYAKLPSKEVLVAKLLFVLQSPIQSLAIAISEIEKKSA